ncbi:MAG: sigma-54-dependent Fis family transcriptional regulator, partial [Myxococcales bacterium]|nr:sigma-54-dependent Fis family transcriptional regulator [Myxococcales bacterium]
NVRELENEVERCWVLSGDDAEISPDLVLPDRGGRSMGLHSLNLAERTKALAKELVEASLTRTSGDHTLAAKLLGVTDAELKNLVREHRLEPQKS